MAEQDKHDISNPSVKRVYDLMVEVDRLAIENFREGGPPIYSQGSDFPGERIGCTVQVRLDRWEEGSERATRTATPRVFKKGSTLFFLNDETEIINLSLFWKICVKAVRHPGEVKDTPAVVGYLQGQTEPVVIDARNSEWQTCNDVALALAFELGAMEYAGDRTLQDAWEAWNAPDEVRAGA